MLRSYVYDVRHAEQVNLWGVAIGGKRALNDSQCSVLFDGFSQSDELLPIGQHRLDGLSDRAAVLSVGASDSLRSTGLKFFNACLKLL